MYRLRHHCAAFRAVTGRECPWACGPPKVMKNNDRNPSRARQEAEIAPDFLDMFFNGVPMALRATNFDEEFRPVTEP